jgi:pimeloyl-ACP methyl ester carboxylesterase
MVMSDGLQLELITRRPEGATTSPPLLFVHGLWHGAWCWDEFFLPYFADHGYACSAVSLRGHGGSPGRERLRSTRVREYVADVADTAASLPEPPVLVGHSLGGFVVQKYLESHTAAGAVLLAPVPPTGALRATLLTVRHHPVRFLEANVRLRLAPLVATPDLARAQFFSESMPAELVGRYQQRLQDDSYLTFLDLFVLDLVRTSRVSRVPMLVLGAADDALITPGQVRRTAKAYGTQAEILPHMAHDMMLDTDWLAVAGRILEWLKTIGSISGAPASAPGNSTGSS